MSHDPQLTAVQSRLEKIKEIVPKESLWKHEKTGNLYRVADHTVLEETLAVAITYESIEAENPVPWSRPSGEFLAKFKRQELTLIDRPIHNWFGLSYANYFVAPRLLLDSMPLDWQRRFVELVEEADKELSAVPDYIVLRDESPYTVTIRSDPEDERSEVMDYSPVLSDPWANYRYGNMQELINDGKK